MKALLLLASLLLFSASCQATLSSEAGNLRAPIKPSKCAYDDQEYAFNETFASKDGCNMCTCSKDFQVVCTELVCTCEHSGQTYNVDEKFNDGANECTCLEDGSVACTEQASAV